MSSTTLGSASECGQATSPYHCSDGPEGSGFAVLVTKTPYLLQPEEAILSIPAGDRSYTVTGLSEAQHYYHVFTKPLDGTCSASMSSAPASTIQDATPPVVTIVSPQDGGVETRSSVTVMGTLSDPPGGNAPSGSGPLLVQVLLTLPTGEGRSLLADAQSGAWTATFTGLSRGVYSVSTSGYDTVTNLGTAPTRHVVVAGADALPPPPSTTTELQGGADGSAYSRGSFSANLAQGLYFNLGLDGRYEGVPAGGSWSCLPGGDYLQCSRSSSLLEDGAGIDALAVMPSTFTISNVSFTLTRAFPSPVGTFTLTGSIFSGQTLRCDGVATANTPVDPEFHPDQTWSLTSPNVGCTVL